MAVAAASTSIPYTTAGSIERVAVDATGSNAVAAERTAVSLDFFSALDVPMKAGRVFTNQDSAAARTAIVNETLARQLFPGRSAIGGQLWIARTAYDIVGIVADYSNHPFETRNSAPKVFLSLPPESTEVKRQSFLIRAAADPAPLVQTVRREVRNAASGNAVTRSTQRTQRTQRQSQVVPLCPLCPLCLISVSILQGDARENR